MIANMFTRYTALGSIFAWCCVVMIAAPAFAETKRGKKRPPPKPIEVEEEEFDEEEMAGDEDDAENDSAEVAESDEGEAVDSDELEAEQEVETEVGKAAAALAKASELAKDATTEADLKKIFRLCEQAEKSKPNRSEKKYARELQSWAHNRMGELIADQGQTKPDLSDAQRKEAEKQAIRSFERAISLDKTRWKAYHNRGVSRGAIGDEEGAIADFDRAIELRPQFHLAWFNRAELRRQRDEIDAASEDYAEAARLAPDDPLPKLGQAMAFARQSRDDEALAAYGAAIALAPENVSFRLERAEFAQAIQRWEVAAAEYAKVLELEDSREAYRGYAWMLATCPLPKFRGAKAAVEAAERALEIARELGSADYRDYDALAAAYANVGRFSEAIAMMKLARETAPPDMGAELDYRANLYTKEKAYRQPVTSGGSAVVGPPRGETRTVRAEEAVGPPSKRRP